MVRKSPAALALLSRLVVGSRSVVREVRALRDRCRGVTIAVVVAAAVVVAVVEVLVVTAVVYW
jgi:hypothetical protein